MKKLLALLLALAMVFVFVACESSDDSTVDDAESVETEDTAGADAYVPTEEDVNEAEGDVSEAGGASGEASGEVGAETEMSPEDESASEEQSLDLYSMDGYEKTFEGYLQWVRDAMSTQTGNPNLESELAALDEVTEEDYDADAQPFQMQIQFGLIVSYEDFLNS